MPSLKLNLAPESILGGFARQDEVTEIQFIPSGMSMYPFIIGGRDTIRLRKQDTVSKLDIVAAYISGEGYVIHRVYDINENRLILMGDKNLIKQERCMVCDMVGVVTHINRWSCDSLSFKILSRIYLRLIFMRRYIIKFIRIIDPRR